MEKVSLDGGLPIFRKQILPRFNQLLLWGCSEKISDVGEMNGIILFEV